MGDALWKRLQLLVSVLSVLLVLALLAAAGGWWRIRASLPELEGTRPLPGLGATVRIERDALGVPVITGATRLDVARATGFVHAQERFFQMDLARRGGAGEVAELFGPVAVNFDRARRIHGFRRLAGQVLARLPATQHALLEAYTAGVNAGLAALRRAPWEYAVLRVDPQPWRTEDCLLVVYAMWLDLQDTSGSGELSRQALRDALGTDALDFFAPPGTSWDSALDGSLFPPAPLPAFRLASLTFPGAPVATDAPKPGSNSFALAGRHVAGGGALLANDMHLDHHVPHTWYRAVLAWTGDDGAPRRLVGVTLPGVPVLVVGSNGRVAWSFTNAYIDTADVIVVEVDTTAGAFYRTEAGHRPLMEAVETIRVEGGAPVSHVVRATEWGPIIADGGPGRLLALRWTAHDADALNFDFQAFESAANVEEALAVAHHAGMPNQNLIAADADGSIAWTITGRIPRRVGFDGRLPVSWAYGDRKWEGWLPGADTPVLLNPPDGLLWSANQRLVGGEGHARLGDGGYDDGPRGRQIRDGLRALATTGRSARPVDLLAIQLDDRAVFLERWQRLLLSVLSDDAVDGHRGRAELREAVRQWNGRASVDSAAYRLVRVWRDHVAARALAPVRARAAARYSGFTFASFQFEDALWRLANDRPAQLLDPEHASWEALLLRAADDVLAETDRAGVAPNRWTWGEANRLHMHHPFSRLLPGWIAAFLNLPADPLPGATDMPRVQTPDHGASERLVVSPGRESEGLFHMPGGQGGNPLSPYYRAGHEAWVTGEPTPLLPGAPQYTLVLTP
jgi:penicillin amidase